MNSKIAEAIQRAKTCAPAYCAGEGICFTLATEVERLYAQLKLDSIEENASEDTSISLAEPNYHAPVPLWEDVT